MTAQHDQPEHALLGEAFARFNEAAATLGDYYNRLAAESAKLNHEVEDKNRRLAESLAEQERTKRFLTYLLDSLSCGVVVLSPEGEIVLANAPASELLGSDGLRPEEATANDAPLEAPLQSPDAWTGRTRKSGEREVIITRNANGRLISSTLSPFPWPGDEGATPGAIALVEDVTEQAMIGVQRERSQTLAAMGEMAAEIAHQVRNPLGGVKLFASLLGREIDGDDNLERMVEQIQNGIRQVEHLITNYLTLAAPPRPACSPCDLRDLVDEALAASSHALDQRGVSKAVVVPKEPVMALVDRDLMLQVLLSLILNAVEAMGKGGRVEIAIDQNDRQLHLRVKDTGRGIPRQDLPRIFNPLFTSKEQNLGLGLAVSHMIMDAHHGLIQVESRPDRGTCVTLTLAQRTQTEPMSGLLKKE